MRESNLLIGQQQPTIPDDVHDELVGEDDQASHVQWEYSFRDSVREWHASRHCDRDCRLHALRRGRPPPRRNLS